MMRKTHEALKDSDNEEKSLENLDNSNNEEKNHDIQQPEAVTSAPLTETTDAKNASGRASHKNSPDTRDSTVKRSSSSDLQQH